MAVGEFLREQPRYAGIVDIHAIGARDYLIDPHVEHVSGLRTLDIDWAGQRVSAAPRIGGANLREVLQRFARHELVVKVHHRFHDDGVAGLNRQHWLLRVVVPAPLGGLHGRRKDVNLALRASRGHDGLRFDILYPRRKPRTGNKNS